MLGAFLIEPLNEWSNNNLGGGNSRLLIFGGLTLGLKRTERLKLAFRAVLIAGIVLFAVASFTFVRLLESARVHGKLIQSSE